MSRKKLIQKIKSWKLKGETIVFTNGCFDLLHSGHLDSLLAAAEQGNRLIVGLNSDTSVKKLKGALRPIVTEQNRAFMLANLTYVDAVVIFEEDTPLELLRQTLPDVLVKGGDYKEEEVVGANLIKENKGKVVIIPLTEGFSTTSIIEKIKTS